MTPPWDETAAEFRYRQRAALGGELVDPRSWQLRGTAGVPEL
ncbi:hypothetical protein [Actinoallomurus sp. CA-142502]